MPYIVALSGGIASGKSTVANLFSQLGVPIVDADIIARQVVKKGTFALSQITEHFGRQILLADGELNRAKLRDIIFHSEQQRQWINQLLHPIIQQETQQQITQINYPYVIWAVPLLIENNLQQYANRVLIIDTPPDLQLARLLKRDNISENLAKSMLSSQISNAQRVSFADDVIVNDGHTSALTSQVEHLHTKYLKLSQNCN